MLGQVVMKVSCYKDSCHIRYVQDNYKRLGGQKKIIKTQKDSGLRLFSKDLQALILLYRNQTENYSQFIMSGVYIRKTMLNCDQPTQNHREGLVLYK